MPEYTNGEYSDMHVIFCRAGGKGRIAQRTCQGQNIRRFAVRTIAPFTNIDRQMRKAGYFQITNCNAGPERSVRIPETLNHRVFTRYTATRILDEILWKVLRGRHAPHFQRSCVQVSTATDGRCLPCRKIKIYVAYYDAMSLHGSCTYVR